MNKIKPLSSEILKEYLHYDETTGIFTWKRNIKRVPVGNIAGTLAKNGYWKIRLFTKEYLAHRLAWLYVYGGFPNGILDHIDRDKLNNRVSNLRVVTVSENGHNANLSKQNTSGYKNIYLNWRDNKYEVSVCINGFVNRLGRYKHIQDAITARDNFRTLREERKENE